MPHKILTNTTDSGTARRPLMINDDEENKRWDAIDWSNDGGAIKNRMIERGNYKKAIKARKLTNPIKIA